MNNEYFGTFEVETIWSETFRTFEHLLTVKHDLPSQKTALKSEALRHTGGENLLWTLV